MSQLKLNNISGTMSLIFFFFIFLSNISFAEDFDNQKLENLIENSRKNNQEVIKKLEEMRNKDGSVNLLKAKKILSNLSSSKSNTSTKVDSKQFSKLLEPFQRMSHSEVVKHIKTSAASFPAAKSVFDKIPKFYEFLANMFKDKKALVSWLEVSKDKTRVGIFIGLNIVIFLFSWALKKRAKAMNHSILRSFVGWCTRFVFINGMRVAVFSFLYWPELNPTIKVFKYTYL